MELPAQSVSPKHKTSGNNSNAADKVSMVFLLFWSVTIVEQCPKSLLLVLFLSLILLFI